MTTAADILKAAPAFYTTPRLVNSAGSPQNYGYHFRRLQESPLPSSLEIQNADTER